MKLLSCIALLLAATPLSLHAQDGAPTSTYGFIENKGQVIDQNHQPNTAVKYLLNTGGLNVQLRGNGFSYDAYTTTTTPGDIRNDVQHKPHRLPEVTNQYHRVDVTLVGANPNPEIVTAQPGNDYINYITPANKEVSVHHYGKVTYKDVYKGIDMEFVTTATKPVEYNFIVHPGADASQIQLKYEGAENTVLNDNRIDMKLAHGNLQETIPASFIQSTHVPVNVHYRNTGNDVYGYTVGNYDKSKTLVIDPVPVLAWATYYGGHIPAASFIAQTRVAQVATYNNDVFIAGYTSATNNIATSGAHQSALSDHNDGFLAKFNSGGVRQWATYYGGTVNDEFTSMAIATNGDMYLIGNTHSNNNICTPGAHKTHLTAGDNDAFIVKLNNAGVRQWGTYYGGTYTERGSGIAVDTGNNIYICGLTTSTSGVATTGAAQSSISGSADGFVAKLNTSGKPIWSTYAGGQSIDELTSIAVDAMGNIFVCGLTTSATGIATAGAHKTTYGGSHDHYLAKYNNDGVRKWATYYGGSGEEGISDEMGGHFLAIDGAGNIYMAGTTTSPNNMSTPGAYKASLTAAGVPDAYLVKFDTAGTRQWGTYYGGDENDLFTSIAADRGGNLHLAGTTVSANGIASPDGIVKTAPSSGIGWDGFYAIFGMNGSFKYGTYFGGDEYDYAYAVAPGNDGRVYLGGVAESLAGIATPGSHSSTRMGATDGFLAAYTVCPGFKTPVISGSASPTYNTNTTYSANVQPTSARYTWQVTGGTLITGQGIANATVKWNVIGQGTIKLTVQEGICADTATLYINSGWPASVNDVSATGISIYPNPATNTVHITLQNAPAHNAVLQLHDGFGKLVLQQNLQKEQNIDISKLPAGVYYLNVGGARSKVTKL